MQYVNDDMDDAFRRAGKDYPLDTSGADWDKIAAGLKYPEQPGNGNDNRRLLWLLLLLPLPWLCMKYNGAGDTAGIANNQKVSIQQNNNDASTIHAQNKQITADKANNEIQNHQQTPSASSETYSQPSSPQNTYLNSNVSASFKTRTNAFHQDKLDIGSRNTKNQSGYNLPVKRNVATNNNTDVANNDISIAGKNQDVNANANANQKEIVKNENQVSVPPVTVSIDAKSKMQPADHANDSANSDLVKKEEAKKDVDLNNVKPVVEKKKPSAAKEKKFYAGVIAGLSTTSIKGQKSSGAGLDAGILAGFNISSHFAIEAGAFSTKKYYYSNGDYYDKSKIYMPSNSKLTTVEGNCRMIEIPVSMRYNFGGKAASWFATAGISNYFMKKEDYDYTYYYYTTNYSATYHKTYTNASKDWLAVMQFSAGKTFSLGKIAVLRLEPYAQLPLKGVGYGKLPLTSYGFRLGLTKQLFR
jgi:hypothetical protein